MRKELATIGIILLFIETNIVTGFHTNSTTTPEPFLAVFAGLITDVNGTGGDDISFKAKFVFFTKANPFEIGRVIPDEEIRVSRDYLGYLGQRFIIGIFNVTWTEYP